MSEYDTILQELFTRTPQFQRVGGSAYKPGLDTTLALAEAIGNPQKSFRTVHVAGTNGKGSVSNMIAAVLQAAGYRVGLYTSPHLVDFRERIRVNGEMISRDGVLAFIERLNQLKLQLGVEPSFFEVTTLMAFDWFAKQHVDVAVIEVGLGGRLDSTNIITPDLAVITNISYDHVQFLGNTLAEIAAEKAGIIKHGIPVIIGESNDEYNSVFREKAQSESAPIIFADNEFAIPAEFDGIECPLQGSYQRMNINTAMAAVCKLHKMGYNISDSSVLTGMQQVCDITGFVGRWTVISQSPLVVCDVGHNIAGISQVVKQLTATSYSRLHFVVGFVSDKDVSHILDILPRDAEYYFTQASIPRAMQAVTLQSMAADKGLCGSCWNSVGEAYTAALSAAKPDDMVFVGGSCYVVADFLSYIQILK